MKSLSQWIVKCISSANTWWVVVMLLLSFLYGYQDIVSKRPQSVHVWRQTDCTSLTLNYYQNGMNFWEPEIHFHASDDKESGYCVGEFPIIYYTVAGLYHIFGPHESILRIFNMLLFFLGLFALFKLCTAILKDRFWAMAITVLFFSSPVIVFYANNFLSNVPAVSMVFIAWYFTYQYYRQKKSYALLLAFGFFTLAGLLKITALLSMIPLGGIILLELFGWHKKLGFQKKMFHQPGLAFGLMAISGFAVFQWYQFAIAYNGSHNSVYFSTHTWPLWDLSTEQIDTILEKIKVLWYKEYFDVSIHILFAILFLVGFWKIKKYSAFYSYMNLCMFIGIICYVLLWFLAFGNHDYYIIDILVWCFFLLVAFLDYLRQHHYRIFQSIGAKLLFGVLLYISIANAHKRIGWRYQGWMVDHGNITALRDIEPYLEEIGIDRKTKVIAIPDPAPNHSLYLMNRPGWTDLYAWNDNAEKMNELIQKGAKYLIVNKAEVLNERPYLKEFTSKKVGEYKGVTIYELPKN